MPTFRQAAHQLFLLTHLRRIALAERGARRPRRSVRISRLRDCARRFSAISGWYPTETIESFEQAARVCEERADWLQELEDGV